jgi:hypothetical protein
VLSDVPLQDHIMMEPTVWHAMVSSTMTLKSVKIAQPDNSIIQLHTNVSLVQLVKYLTLILTNASHALQVNSITQLQRHVISVLEIYKMAFAFLVQLTPFSKLITQAINVSLVLQILSILLVQMEPQLNVNPARLEPSLVMENV